MLCDMDERDKEQYTTIYSGLTNLVYIHFENQFGVILL